MGYYSYKVEHDYGLAPNPFGQYCTLAVCKPSIRGNRNLKLGDWVIGTGSVTLGNLHHLIFTMQVQEKITLDEYWNDPRFQYKKPITNGSLVQMYGDNFYHQDSKNGNWIQENSAHSLLEGKVNQKHLNTDTGGKHVLISTHFYYLGDECALIPEKFREVCNEGRDMKGPSIPTKTGDQFIDWVRENFNLGITGDPISWNEH